MKNGTYTLRNRSQNSHEVEVFLILSGDMMIVEEDKPPSLHKAGLIRRLAQLGISIGVDSGVLIGSGEMDTWRDLPCPDPRLRAHNY